MKILWISDFFLEDGVYGGAELVDNIIISELKKNHTVDTVNSANITYKELGSYEKLIFSNFVLVSNDLLKKISSSNIEYLIMEHDHKYLSNRDPSPFRSQQAPPKYIKNYNFYKSAKAVLCQSSGHAQCLIKNLYIENIVNLGSSIWSTDQYEHLRQLGPVSKNDKYAIVDSPNSVKNTSLAVKYCNKNSIQYDLISDKNWNSFVKKMSTYKGLVFFPKVYESFCRLIVEARMMNLEVITNDKIGAITESWFHEIKGEELINFLQENKKRIFNTLEECIEGKVNSININKPKVSIITSMFKGAKHLKPFLLNMINQTYFKNCELIIINANSPENEDEIIEPYLQKYDNIFYERLDHDPGIYGTWNYALKKTTGKYITNANLDDRRSLKQIEELVKTLEYNPDASLSYTECYVTHTDDEDFYNNSSEGQTYPASGFSKENMIKCLPGCMPLWKREIHETCGSFNESYKMAGDWEMWLRAVKNGYSFVKVETPLGLYYFNPEGLSTSKDKDRATERYNEEKDIFWKYTDVFGQRITERYREYFSQ